MKRQNITDCFTQHRSIEYPKRTIEHIHECANTYAYKYKYLSLIDKGKTNVQRNGTGRADVCSIVANPCLDICLDDVTKAGVHVVQGVIRLFVDWLISELGFIKQLEAGLLTNYPEGTVLDRRV